MRQIDGTSLDIKSLIGTGDQPGLFHMEWVLWCEHHSNHGADQEHVGNTDSGTCTIATMEPAESMSATRILGDR